MHPIVHGPSNARSTARRSLRPALVSFLLLSVAFAATLPAPAALAKATPFEITDAPGDVKFTNALPGSPPTSDGLDLTKASIFGGNGAGFLLRTEHVNLAQENTYPPGVSGGNLVQICFTWKDTLYGVRITYRTGNTPVLYQRIVGVVDGACDPLTDLTFVSGKSADLEEGVDIDFAKNRITIAIVGVTLGGLTGIAPPRTGDAIGGLWAIATDQKHLRYDAAPDTAPAAGAYLLEATLANQGDLVAAVQSNIGAVPCDGRLDAPAYAIDAGGIGGVPMTLRNKGSTERTVRFLVETEGGLDWKPRVVAQLNVPAETNRTITVIVDMPATTKHKDCSILHMLAIDTADASVVGEASVNLIAVQGPTPTASRLYMHASTFANNACDSRHTWLNVLENDPDGADGSILLRSCRDPLFPVPIPPTPGTVSLVPAFDVNPSRDLVVNTSASKKPAEVVVKLKSDYAPTKARLTAILKTAEGDGNLIGEGFIDTEITSTAADVRIPINIAFTRDQVATGDPSRVLASTEGLRLEFVYTPLPADGNVEGLTVAGRVSLITKGSYIDLPVWDTIRRNHVAPGVTGSTLSITAVGELPQFAVPGSVRLFNYTVQNEGAAADVAVITGTFTGAPGWTVTFSPGARIPLASGESRAIQAIVAPPADAVESAVVVFDVVAVSEKDATARSSVATKIVASREATVPRDLAPNLGAGGDGSGLLPAPNVLLVLSALLAGLFAWRRRAPPQHL